MVQSAREQGALFLPPGFRFHPTDEEVITSYLLQKFFNPSFSSQAVGEVDLNKCEPWDLPSKAKMGEKEWYFFCQKDMKYPTGMRTNRATKEGYWKATGKDKEIVKKPGGVLVGMKKTLVFYKGRAPRGSKTNWVMHEFRLEGNSRDNANLRINPKDEWVVCKVFHKKGPVKNTVETAGITKVNPVIDDSVVDDFIDSLIDPAYFNSNNLHNTEYSASVGRTKTESFLPNYSSFNTSYQVGHNSSIPTSSSGAPQGSSWNNLLSGQDHGMESYMYYQEDLLKALGGVVDPNFVVSSKVLPSSAKTGVQLQNSFGASQQKLGSYGDTTYGSYLT